MKTVCKKDMCAGCMACVEICPKNAVSEKIPLPDTLPGRDTFCTSVLHDVLNNGLENRSRESLEAMLRFANAAAYLVTTKKGAIRSMPEPEDVEKILQAN